MQTNQLEAKMKKQIAVSMQSLEWFILHSFIKTIVESEEHVKTFFTSAEDAEVIESILSKIQRQFAPHLQDNCEHVESIEKLLSIEPKKLYTGNSKILT